MAEFQGFLRYFLKSFFETLVQEKGHFCIKVLIRFCSADGMFLICIELNFLRIQTFLSNV